MVRVSAGVCQEGVGGVLLGVGYALIRAHVRFLAFVAEEEEDMPMLATYEEHQAMALLRDTHLHRQRRDAP